MQVNLINQNNRVIHVADGPIDDVEEYIRSTFNRFPYHLYGTWITRKDLSMQDDYCFVTIQRELTRNDIVNEYY